MIGFRPAAPPLLMPAPDELATTWLGVVAEEDATAAAAAAAASDCDRAASKLLVDVVVP